MIRPKWGAFHKKNELSPSDYRISLIHQQVIILGIASISDGHKWNQIAKATL